MCTRILSMRNQGSIVNLKVKRSQFILEIKLKIAPPSGSL